MAIEAHSSLKSQAVLGFVGWLQVGVGNAIYTKGPSKLWCSTPESSTKRRSKSESDDVFGIRTIPNQPTRRSGPGDRR